MASLERPDWRRMKASRRDSSRKKTLEMIADLLMEKPTEHFLSPLRSSFLETVISFTQIDSDKFKKEKKSRGKDMQRVQRKSSKGKQQSNYYLREKIQAKR